MHVAMFSVSPSTVIPPTCSKKISEPNLQTYLEEELQAFLGCLGTLNHNGPSFSSRYSLTRVLPSMVYILKLRLKFG